MISFAMSSGNHNNPKSIEYALKAIDLAKEINFTRGLIEAYEVTGDAYWYRYDYASSVDFYMREKRLADSLNLPVIVAKANYNIGWITCVQQGVFSERKNLIHALKVFERINDTTSVIQVLNALASTYQNQSYINAEYLDSANNYFRNMVFLAEQNSRARKGGGLIPIYSNYSQFLVHIQKYNEAKKYLHKCLNITKAQRDTFGYLTNMVGLAQIYYSTDSLQKAKDILVDVVGDIRARDYKSSLLDLHRLNFLIAYKQKDYKEALSHHMLFKDLNDSLNIQIFRSNLQEKETAYELEKKENNIRKLEQMNEVALLKNKQNNYIILGMGVVAVLIIGLAFNLYKSNKNKQKANLMLSEQNRIIADKKEEIEQSIHYAKGIQNAILPSMDELKRTLPNSFIIYLPKDVVSGDFYWFHKIESYPLNVKGSDRISNNHQLLVAAADCTGHGVPGSLMSIVSVDKLNQAIFEKKLHKPAQILGSINNDIKNALKQDTGTNKQKDGLDIALLLIDFVAQAITYSAANRPLWIVRNGEVIEYKATKTSIAGHTGLNFEFAEQTILVQKNDLVIIFSDGYADQFGGPGGKKMMTKRFKDELVLLAGKQVDEIESALVKGFNAWKGKHEQVDDVLVIGFKI
ncbi:MAG: protein serine/threonine phosphatase [Bacteroidetes bacterium]|jgi:serine phosphatase RsbU (regulator of sigma subunit)|nr:protein serine/threonine phosphatase [Bacteroidota bacterium]